MSRLGLFMAPFMVASCMSACSSDDSSTPADGTGGTSGSSVTPVTFTADIHPILQAKCGTSGCHDGSQVPTLPAHGAADLQEAYEATQGLSFTGDKVYERILVRVGTDDPGFMMPPNPPCSGMLGGEGCITAAELALIQEWVDQGTPL